MNSGCSISYPPGVPERIGLKQTLRPGACKILLHYYAYFIMLLCMRTTIEIADELLRQAKTRAADDGIPLRQVIESALRLYILGRRGRGGYRLRWRAERGRIQPGVRLDDRDALFDLMEGRP